MTELFSKLSYTAVAGSSYFFEFRAFLNVCCCFACTH